MNVKQDGIKPVGGVVNTEKLHPLFFDQFLKNYRTLKQKKTDFTALVLSGLFLHLTLESYITWTVRWLLENVNRRKNRRPNKLWENHFENNANLKRKVQFFSDVFLTDADKSKVEEIKKFAGSLGFLRNKIVHGHEFSVTHWSDGKVEKTELAELLTIQKIDENYKNFKECMDIMSALIEKIDIEDMTSGIPSKEWVIEHLTFKF